MEKRWQAHTTKKCKKCQMKYYLSFTQSSDGKKTFKDKSMCEKYIIISSQTGFETSFLRTTSDLIETAALTFSAATESYERTHSVSLERQRLEEAYFVVKLLETFRSNCQPLSFNQRDSSCRLDLESACLTAMELICASDNVFHNHSCDVTGCKEGVLVADGIEKVGRL